MTALNRSILKNMFKTPLLRNILLVCLAVSILFPIYGIFYEIPSLTRVVQKISEDEALTVTKHLTKTIFPDRYTLKKEFFSNDVIAETKVIIEDFQLEKIKIFSESGEIVYSSDSQDIGKLNRKEYFHEIVAKGSIYSKVVKKEDKTLEGRIVNADVVEIYVPLIDKGKFQGAFEIYYDITDKREMLNKQWRHSLYFLSALALIVFISIILLLLRASKLNLDSKESESTLREGEEKYRTLIENAGEAIIVAQDGVFKFANPKGEELYGFSKEELASRPLTDFIHEEDREMVGERHKRRLRGEELPKTYPFRIINKVGDTKWVQLSAAPFSWDNKPAVLCYMTNITGRKQTEEALRESEEKYRILFESSKDPSYITTREGDIVEANQSHLDLFGYTREEIFEWKAQSTYVDPDDRSRFKKEIEENGFVKDFEARLRKKDGTEIDCLVTATARRSREGSIVGYQGIIRDVTELKHSEEALRESEQKYRTVLESNPDPVVVYDKVGKVTYMNPAFTRVFGWSLEEVIGKKMDDFVPEETWPETKIMIDKVLAGERFSGIETRRYTKDKKNIPVAISASFYRDQKGDLLASVVNLRDISEQKRMEAELERLSYHDALTGVANRRHFDQNLNLEWRRLTRIDKPLSLIMCDIDFFKAYNDTYGHQEGDKCLKSVGNVLKGSGKRAGDLIARYGGEEFALLLPMTDAENTFKIAEKVQRDINSLKIPHKKSEVSSFVTLSFGLATLCSQTNTSPDHLVELADKALYQAKHEGRNRVIIS